MLPQIVSVQLVYTYYFTRVDGGYIYSIHGIYKPTNITIYSIHGISKPTFTSLGGGITLYKSDLQWPIELGGQADLVSSKIIEKKHVYQKPTINPAISDIVSNSQVIKKELTHHATTLLNQVLFVFSWWKPDIFLVKISR